MGGDNSGRILRPEDLKSPVNKFGKRPYMQEGFNYEINQKKNLRTKTSESEEFTF